jgi:hypothetical protein
LNVLSQALTGQTGLGSFGQPRTYDQFNPSSWSTWGSQDTSGIWSQSRYPWSQQDVNGWSNWNQFSKSAWGLTPSSNWDDWCTANFNNGWADDWSGMSVGQFQQPSWVDQSRLPIWNSWNRIVNSNVMPLSMSPSQGSFSGAGVYSPSIAGSSVVLPVTSQQQALVNGQQWNGQQWTPAQGGNLISNGANGQTWSSATNPTWSSSSAQSWTDNSPAWNSANGQSWNGNGQGYTGNGQTWTSGSGQGWSGNGQGWSGNGNGNGLSWTGNSNGNGQSWTGTGNGQTWNGQGWSGTGNGQNWNGNGNGQTWNGQSWTGNGNGNGQTWNGQTWTGNGNGQNWNGQSWTGNGIGQTWNGQSWAGNGQGWNGQSWTGNGNGQSWNGQSWTGNGFGQTWNGQGWSGNGQTWNGEGQGYGGVGMPGTAQCSELMATGTNTNATLQCPAGQVIQSITQAAWGQSAGTCQAPTSTIGQCTSDVTSTVSRMCLNQNMCTFGATIVVLGAPMGVNGQSCQPANQAGLMQQQSSANTIVTRYTCGIGSATLAPNSLLNFKPNSASSRSVGAIAVISSIAAILLA